MTTLAQQSGCIAWLKGLLHEQRGIVKELMYRMSFLGTPGSMKPSVFGKFLKTLEQISVEKEHESDIISRIQDIECRHRLQREFCQLKTASAEESSERSRIELNPADEPEPESGNSGWLMLLGALAFLRTRNPNPLD